MAQNPTGADTKEIALSTFAGLVTYMSPSSLPMGASPDCSDNSFLPGGVSQRPCLKKALATPLGSVTITYGKSFVAPDGTIRNLYLDSSGNLWVENITDGTPPTILANSTPGSYAKSITAFGREYIAISDGLHGQEVPLQYDGTFLDRVTQDGPGASPNVTSLIIPAVQMPSSSTPAPTLTVTGVFPAGQIGVGGYFTVLGIFIIIPATYPTIGQQVTLTGTPFDGSYTVIALPSDGSIQVSAYSAARTPSYTGPGTLTVGSGIPDVTMVRQNNIVTVPTATPHNLQVGYLAQISGVTAGQVGGGIVSVAINNEDEPGIATVTTTDPHGLVPGASVSLQGIVASAIGGGISSIQRTGGIVTVVMSAATGLAPGGTVTVAGVSDTSFDGVYSILNVTTTTLTNDTFTYAQAYSVDATSSGGTVGLNWPIINGPTPSYFEVQSAPTATTFQVQIFYPDGSWTGGTVSFAWDGTFFVKTIVSPTVFQYQQYGPDATTTDVGTVTPFGEAAPGFHLMQVFFITRQGYTTAPSPPVKFEANGGQFVAVSNIPIGPPNVVARALAFTGAQGAYFYYIPAPPQINGQLVGTATQINDNTTTSVVLDFSDTTLFSALGISIQGNNLANQIVLDSALGFGFYGSRLFTYGQRNAVDNLLNMGFDGGYLPSNPTVPTGWNLNSASPGGSLGVGHYGQGWQIAITPGGTECGLISQSFYEDYTGAPIGQGQTNYRVRLWARSNIAAGDAGIELAISSFLATFTSFASIAGVTTAGGWHEADFTMPTPSAVYPDMILSLWGVSTTTAGVTITVDEVSIIYVETPYRTGCFASYANNPEGMDGVSGVIGPEDDTHQVMDLGIIRNNLYMLTQDPSGRLHETAQGVTEPAEWIVSEVAANCGTVSAICMTRSQADSGTPAGGEEWFAWVSSTGIRIFGGEAPDKISQEIQRPKGQVFPGAPQDLGALNPQAQLTAWGLNDPDQKIMWFGIPTGIATAPNVIYQLSYLGLDSAGAIVSSPPIHKSLSGRLVATDLGRKWSPWKLPMNGAALMYRAEGQLQPVFFGGNGQYPNSGIGTSPYTQAVTALTTLSVPEATHGKGTTPYVLAIDSSGNLVAVSVINALSGGVPTGNMTIQFGAAFTGTVVVGSGGVYSQSVAAVTSVTITESTHGQGLTPYVIGIDPGGNFVYPAIENIPSGGAPSGNMQLSFLPAFTGLIIIGSGNSFVQPQNSVTSVNIPANVHGQGKVPYVLAIDSSGNLVDPIIINAISGGVPSGNLTVNFNPAFTGVIVVGSESVTPGYGNVYTLDATRFTDDDYGEMFPYYVTYAFPDRDQEQQLQIGGHMKMIAYTHAFISGVGILTITILYETLANAWALNGVYVLQGSPLFDLEWGGGNAQAQRFFFKYSMAPNPAGSSAEPSTDVAFGLTSVVISMKQAKRMPVRGSYP